MDGYPASSLDHNVPLIVVSGLTDAPVNELSFGELENSVLIQSDIPALDTHEAVILEEYFASLDNRQPPWKVHPDAGKAYKFRAITAGRV
jgi:hypothetical protein